MLVLFVLYTTKECGTFRYMESPTIKSLKIGVWPATRDKLDSIAAAKLWTLAVTVDVLADEFIESHGLSVKCSSPSPGDGNQVNP